MIDSIVSALNCFVAIWLTAWFLQSGNSIYVGMSLALALINFMFFVLFWFDDDLTFSEDELAEVAELI